MGVVPSSESVSVVNPDYCTLSNLGGSLYAYNDPTTDVAGNCGCGDPTDPTYSDTTMYTFCGAGETCIENDQVATGWSGGNTVYLGAICAPCTDASCEDWLDYRTAVYAGGVDCSALPHVDGVQCIDGECVIIAQNPSSSSTSEIIKYRSFASGLSVCFCTASTSTETDIRVEVVVPFEVRNDSGVARAVAECLLDECEGYEGSLAEFAKEMGKGRKGVYFGKEVTQSATTFFFEIKSEDGRVFLSFLHVFLDFIFSAVYHAACADLSNPDEMMQLAVQRSIYHFVDPKRFAVTGVPEHVLDLTRDDGDEEEDGYPGEEKGNDVWVVWSGKDVEAWKDVSELEVRVLMRYLTVEALLHKELAFGKDRVCTDLNIQILTSFSPLLLIIQLINVQPSHLPTASIQLRNFLSAAALGEIDMKRMRDVVEKMEGVAGEYESLYDLVTIAHHDAVFGARDGTDLEALWSTVDFERVKKMSSRDWQTLIWKTLVAAPSLTIVGKSTAGAGEAIEERIRAAEKEALGRGRAGGPGAGRNLSDDDEEEGRRVTEDKLANLQGLSLFAVGED
ncbi:hypothetical protein MNV49_004526 [Pseudohyphozyma bogoriensis]|nr:hypothetical protein MNV49_004526 [Pseudohyphozyma bogoriensis]